jgi:hypothetical protein
VKYADGKVKKPFEPANATIDQSVAALLGDLDPSIRRKAISINFLHHIKVGTNLTRSNWEMFKSFGLDLLLKFKMK